MTAVASPWGQSNHSHCSRRCSSRVRFLNHMRNHLVWGPGGFKFNGNVVLSRQTTSWKILIESLVSPAPCSKNNKSLFLEFERCTVPPEAAPIRRDGNASVLLGCSVAVTYSMCFICWRKPKQKHLESGSYSKNRFTRTQWAPCFHEKGPRNWPMKYNLTAKKR